MRPILPVLAVLALSAAPAGAARFHYEAYAAGLNVLDMDADFEVTAEHYRVVLDVRTVGALGLLSNSHTHTVVDGRFLNGKPVPVRFLSTGVLRGETRQTVIDYPGGEPDVRQLIPPNEKEREDVPPQSRRGTVDTLSAMAELVRQVNETGRCEGQAQVYDGRRLSTLEARTSGQQALPATGRSSFAGQTLRCDFRGQMLAGFRADEDRETQQRVQQGTAWFAAVVPGGPMVPVRVAFHTRWFGEATMYLAKPPG